MRQAAGFILLILFFSLRACFAAEVPGPNEDADLGPLAKRPLVEYKSSGLRSPFQSAIISTQELEAKPQEKMLKPLPDLSGLRVQGVIWGGKVPQAIINNNVVRVGDSVQGAEVVAIEKSNITLSSAGNIFVLPTDGKATLISKNDGGG